MSLPRFYWAFQCARINRAGAGTVCCLPTGFFRSRSPTRQSRRGFHRAASLAGVGEAKPEPILGTKPGLQKLLFALMGVVR